MIQNYKMNFSQDVHVHQSDEHLQGYQIVNCSDSTCLPFSIGHIFIFHAQSSQQVLNGTGNAGC